MELLLAILLGVATQRGPVSEADRARLYQVALDMWGTAAESTLMCGPARQTATALALASVAVHESGLHADVQDCRRCYKGSPWCDQGRSVGLFQLHVGSGAWLSYSRAEICEDNGLSTMLALRILERHRRGPTALHVVRGYARGGRREAAGEMAAIYSTMLAKARVVVTYQSGCLTARSLPDATTR